MLSRLRIPEARSYLCPVAHKIWRVVKWFLPYFIAALEQYIKRKRGE